MHYSHIKNFHSHWAKHCLLAHHKHIASKVRNLSTSYGSSPHTQFQSLTIRGICMLSIQSLIVILEEKDQAINLILICINIEQ